MKPVILTIDDDPIVRKLVNKAMQSLNCSSVEVPSGIEGLNYLEKHHPQLILLDIMMPVLNGFEVLKKIKAHREWRSIPIIMFSAVSEEKRVKEALELGATDYLLKPFRLRTVQEKVKQIVENPTKSRRARVRAEKLTGAAGNRPGMVMVVSTNDQTRNRLFRLFRKRGIRLVHADGAIEGLRLLGSSTPDMIIIDKNLNLFTGPEFEEKVRQNSSWKTIPMIGISETTNGFKNSLSLNTDDTDILNRIEKLWQERYEANGDVGESGGAKVTNYRLLYMTETESAEKWIRNRIGEAYNTKLVDNSTDLIGDILTWKPDFILMNYDELKDDVKGILKRCHTALRGSSMPFYLFSREAMAEHQVQGLKNAGFEEVVVYDDTNVDLVQLLDERFGVNMIEEIQEDTYVHLKRRPMKNNLAGREILHRIVNKRKDGFQKFIVDYRKVDSVEFEELQYLGQVTNYQTRFGVRMCIVSQSEKITETFHSFQETAGVKVFNTMKEATDFLK
ncbi:MAG: response regulator [Candidatus Marinimicrobia bacterium]|nr:response regulator [Candidatus Neomarinimicrobiota bacterium]MCF7880529.1 response regulator [Candidatus Neomarinimicrobiota bacterium]